MRWFQINLVSILCQVDGTARVLLFVGGKYRYCSVEIPLSRFQQWSLIVNNHQSVKHHPTWVEAQWVWIEKIINLTARSLHRNISTRCELVKKEENLMRNENTLTGLIPRERRGTSHTGALERARVVHRQGGAGCHQPWSFAAWTCQQWSGCGHHQKTRQSWSHPARSLPPVMQCNNQGSSRFRINQNHPLALLPPSGGSQQWSEVTTTNIFQWWLRGPQSQMTIVRWRSVVIASGANALATLLYSELFSCFTPDGTRNSTWWSVIHEYTLSPEVQFEIHMHLLSSWFNQFWQLSIRHQLWRNTNRLLENPIKTLHLISSAHSKCERCSQLIRRRAWTVCCRTISCCTRRFFRGGIND